MWNRCFRITLGCTEAKVYPEYCELCERTVYFSISLSHSHSLFFVPQSYLSNIHLSLVCNATEIGCSDMVAVLSVYRRTHHDISIWIIYTCHLASVLTINQRMKLTVFHLCESHTDSIVKRSIVFFFSHQLISLHLTSLLSLWLFCTPFSISLSPSH